MNETIKFDKKNYGEIRNYLDAHSDLHGRVGSDDSRVYYTGWRNLSGEKKGLILHLDSVSIMNEHSCFPKIKSDLRMIAGKR